MDAEVARVVREAAATLERAGATVTEDHPDLAPADEVFRTLRAWQFQATFGELLAEHPDGLKQSLADNIRAGSRSTGADVARAFRLRTSVMETARRFFESYDVLVLPVSQVPPFPADQEFPTADQRPADGELPRLDALGLPGDRDRAARRSPCRAARPADGLPVGVQLVARHGADRFLLEVAVGVRGNPRDARGSARASVPAMPVELIRAETLTDTAPYAYAARVPGGDLVFTAGACPLDADGEIGAVGDLAGQAALVMDNLRAALAAAGAGLEDVAKSTVYVATTDRADLVAVWERGARRLRGPRRPEHAAGGAVAGLPRPAGRGRGGRRGALAGLTTGPQDFPHPVESGGLVCGRDRHQLWATRRNHQNVRKLLRKTLAGLGFQDIELLPRTPSGESGIGRRRRSVRREASLLGTCRGGWVTRPPGSGATTDRSGSVTSTGQPEGPL